jgi:hypothetical protein
LVRDPIQGMAAMSRRYVYVPHESPRVKRAVSEFIDSQVIIQEADEAFRGYRDVMGWFSVLNAYMVLLVFTTLFVLAVASLLLVTSFFVP